MAVGGFPNEYDPLTYRIIGAAVEVHRLLGPGLLESIYEVALCHEFGLQGIEFERQKPVDMRYKDILIGGQRIDLVVAGEVVVELKSQSPVPPIALAQILSYLRATGLRRGLIVNFSVAILRDGIQRVRV